MARYDLRQITDSLYDIDIACNSQPSISDDGSRVVFGSRIGPHGTQFAICLYDATSGEDARILSVEVDGDERILMAKRPRISSAGQHIIFHAPFFYTRERQTGIYLYEIDSGRIILRVPDSIRRFASGAPEPGRPDGYKDEKLYPCFSVDPYNFAYIRREYRYAGTSTRDGWVQNRDVLVIADNHGARDIVSTTGMIYSLGMDYRAYQPSQRIAFYAHGTMVGADVTNIEMPLDSPHAYCYVVTIYRDRNELVVAPDPNDTTRPLVVVEGSESIPNLAFSNNIQSFDTYEVLFSPPSISGDGNRVAFTAGLAMGAINTGVYIFEPSARRRQTQPIITFRRPPGEERDGNTLETGVAPSLSPDGVYVAFCDRRVTFPEGYGDPSRYEEGRTYCPRNIIDDIVIRHLPNVETTRLLGEAADPAHTLCGCHSSVYGVACAHAGEHIAFVSRCDKVNRNPDLVEQIYYAVRLEE